MTTVGNWADCVRGGPATKQQQLTITVPCEEGFVSGPTSEDNCAYIDRLALEMGNIGFQDDRYLFGSTVTKCASDSGASSGELDQSMIGSHHEMMKEDQSGSMALGAVGTTASGTQQLPGAWFYEVGSGDDDSSSPTQDFLDENPLLLAGLRGGLTTTTTRTVTETVEVPSSEHVAEIVGRQGCKIKALRAKTNTYIKTPVRGEDPVFMVTGRPEDVVEAKREIECAAEHFTQIRASRRHSQGGVPAPGHITAYVRVPLRVVGLVVGPKGATIKRIQQDTHTYIITPSREREPVFEVRCFEVTGLPQNVEAARKEIEQHIYQRTGNMPITDPSANIGSYDLLAKAKASFISQIGQMKKAASVNNISSLSAAASAAARSSYGSLAATSSLRRQENAACMPQNNVNYDFLRHNTVEAAYAAGIQGLFRLPTKSSYSVGGSPPAASPSLFTASGPQSTASSNGATPYPQWSNAYASLGIGAENATSLTASSLDLFGSRSSALSSGGSLWNSPFLASTDQLSSISNQRDEGLGDSPPNMGGPCDPYNVMSSIWSDMDKHNAGVPAAPIDTATVFNSGIDH